MARFNPAPWAAILPLIVGACSHDPAPPPVLSLDTRACANQFDLISAPLLQFGQPVTLPVTGETACWQGPNGAKSTYLAFHLPSPGQPYLVSVTSRPQGDSLFSPRLMVVDFHGNVLREESRDRFLFHGVSLAATIYAYPGDYGLVVASDPATVGTGNSQIVERTHQSTVTTSTGSFNLYTGSDTAETTVNSHSGNVTVVARPMPKGD